MTALSGPILFNNSTGSDSAASGCGPATAISVMLQTSAGSNVANASWSGTISVGDLIYVPANTGRKFNVVAVVGSGSLTFDDNWDDSQMGTAGYVGGKRATLDNADSRNMFLNFKHGWIVELETDQDLTSPLIWNQNWSGQVPASILRGDGGQLRTINQTTDACHFGKNNTANFSSMAARIENIKFTNSASTKTSNSSVIFWFYNTTAHLFFVNCVFGDSTNPIYSFNTGGGAKIQGMIFNCVFDSTISAAMPYASDPANLIVDSCIFKDCNAGITQTNTTGAFNVPFVKNCIFAGITNNAIEISSAPNQGSQAKIYGCVFYNCGIGFRAGSSPRPLIIHDCIFSSCTTAVSLTNNYFGYGFADFRRNAFYGNGTNFIEASGQDGTHYEEFLLTADPFVSASTGDFNLNADAGGGATLRANNFSLNTDTAVYPFRQYVSDAFGAGGGGAVLHPLRSN